MTFLFAILGGVAGAAIAYLIGAFGTLLIATSLAVSDREGAIGYFAFFFVGPIAGVIGLLVGVWLVLRYWGGHRAFPALAGRGLLVIGAIAALVAAGIFIRLQTLPTFQGPEPRLEFEIRLPPGRPAPDKRMVNVELHTDKNSSDGLLFDDWLRLEGDRQVLRGVMPLYFRTSQRILVLKLAGEPDRLFVLRLWASPSYTKTLGAWQKLDYVATASEQPRKPDPGDDFELRFRVFDPSAPR
jgi:MFS family permease